MELLGQSHFCTANATRVEQSKSFRFVFRLYKFDFTTFWMTSDLFQKFIGEEKNTVEYHFIGTKCGKCGSYNTKILKTSEFPEPVPQTPALNLLFLSEDLRCQGNSIFKEGKFAEALEKYKAAIEKLEEAKKSEGYEAIQEKVCFSFIFLTGNCSACFFEMEKWNECAETSTLLFPLFFCIFDHFSTSPRNPPTCPKYKHVHFPNTHQSL